MTPRGSNVEMPSALNLLAPWKQLAIVTARSVCHRSSCGLNEVAYLDGSRESGEGEGAGEVAVARV